MTLDSSRSDASLPRVRALLVVAVVGFAAAEGATRLFDLYRRTPWVDVPIHFLAGAGVTAAIFLYLHRRGVERKRLWSMIGNAAGALLWEVAEMVDEVFRPDPVYLQDVFVWDGVGDVASALAGGLLVLWAVRRKDVA